ncbi:YggT family protein [Catenovulum sp. SM1970]|uniref:YggT family protein n=1 Tax=Marinifaba aquimaris TaxID=2741323 RepID=UPI0015740236|nr:YggT family protein [Marinifaba aquimaris]NTS78085.1 YggT family protein [Marinifaba aquimaris]
MNALHFLIETLFGLYLMVVLLRVWLQLVRADFYNPFSQFVVKATNPLVVPLRRIIPGFGGLDLASVILALVIGILKYFVLSIVLSQNIPALAMVIFGAVSVLKEAFQLVFWILVIRAILSWFSQGQNPMEYVLMQLTEPLLKPIRKILPQMGGLDSSILILLIGLQFVNYLIIDMFGRF